MSLGSQQGSSISVANSAPWNEAQPYLKQGFQRASQLLGSNAPAFFPTSTVTPHSVATTDSLRMIEDRARQGSPLVDQMQDELGSTIAGEYYTDPNIAGARGMLDKTIAGDYMTAGNPYMDALTSRFSDDIGQAVNSRFIASGRDIGSGAAESEFTRQLANSMVPHMFANYERERGNQLGATNAALGQYAQERARQMGAMDRVPAALAQDYTDAGMLGQVGASREALGEAQLADQIQRWNFEQNQPAMKLQQFNEAIRGAGALGGSVSNITPISRNPLGSALSGASTGAGIGSLLAGRGNSSSAMWPLLGAGLGLLGG